MSYNPTTTSGGLPTAAPPYHTSVSHLKRKMTLDLNTAKRSRVGDLNTPDLLTLKLSTPEFNKLIENTTNPLQTPTSVFFPKNVTEEQELYVKGFDDALKSLHENASASSFDDHDSNGSSFDNVMVKEEPQTVPDSDLDSDDSMMMDSHKNMTPIDMESQEKIKLERKRQRNRLAASKCRRRKLERIAKLEDKVKQLKTENSELGNVLLKLRETVHALKSNVMEHVQAGCPIMLNLNTNSTFNN